MHEQQPVALKPHLIGLSWLMHSCNECRMRLGLLNFRHCSLSPREVTTIFSIHNAVEAGISVFLHGTGLSTDLGISN